MSKNKKKSRGTYAEDILEILKDSKIKVSAQEIIKRIASKRDSDPDRIRGPVKSALKKLIFKKDIIQLKGTGARGSFILNNSNNFGQPSGTRPTTLSIGKKLKKDSVEHKNQNPHNEKINQEDSSKSK